MAKLLGRQIGRIKSASNSAFAYREGFHVDGSGFQSWRSLGAALGLSIYAVTAGALAQEPADAARGFDAMPVVSLDIAAEPNTTAVVTEPVAEAVVEVPTASDEPVVQLDPKWSEPGKWRTHAAIQTGATYDDNLFISPDDEESDFSLSLRPEIWTGWGDVRGELPTLTGMQSRFLKPEDRADPRSLLFVRYAPTATWHLDHPGEDSLEHDAGISGRIAFDRTTFRLDTRYETLSAPDIDRGSRSDRAIATASVRADYKISDKTALEADLGARRTDYEDGYDSTDVSSGIFAHYRVLPKTVVGLGGRIGHLQVEDGDAQIYEQALVSARYSMSKKVAFDGKAGAEFRQVDGGQNVVNPVFEIGAEYAPIDSTLLSLQGSRRIDNSASLEGVNVERTTIDLALRQSVLRKVWLTLRGSYQNGEYEAAGSGDDLGRSDDFFVTGFDAAMDITKWVNLRVGYRFEHNDSSQEQFSFTRNVADLRVSVLF